MTALPLVQSEILNGVRYKSERREEIARTMAARQTEMAIQQAEIQKLFQLIAERQESIKKIADEMAKLSAEDAKLQTDTMESLNQLDENGALKPVKLDFPDDETICWNGKHLPLVGKPHEIVKVLYLAKRCVTANILGKAVWNDEAISPKTITPTISKLNTKLKEANFPYKIKSVQCKKRSVPTRDLLTGKVQVKTFRSTTVGYKLVFRQGWSLNKKRTKRKERKE